MNKLTDGLRNNILLVVGAFLSGMAGVWCWGLIIGAGAAYLHCLFNGITRGRTLKEGLILCSPTMMLFGVIFAVGSQTGGGLNSLTGWAITIILMLVSAFVGSFVSGSKDYNDKINESGAAPTVRPQAPPHNTEQSRNPAHDEEEQEEPAPRPNNRQRRPTQEVPVPVESHDDDADDNAQVEAEPEPEPEAIGTTAALANARNRRGAKRKQANRPLQASEEEALHEMIRDITGLQDITSSTFALAYNALPADERAKLPSDPEKALIYKMRGETISPNEIVCRKVGHAIPEFILKPLMSDSNTDNIDKVAKLFLADLPDPLNSIPVTTLIWYVPNALFSSSLEQAIRDNLDELTQQFSNKLPTPLKYINLRTLWGALPAEARMSPKNIYRDIEYNTPKLMEMFDVSNLDTFTSSLDTQLPIEYRGKTARMLYNHIKRVNPALTNTPDSEEAIVLRNLEVLQVEATEESDVSDVQAQTFYSKLSRSEKLILPTDPVLAYQYHQRGVCIPFLEAIRKATGIKDFPAFLLKNPDNDRYSASDVQNELKRFDLSKDFPECLIPEKYLEYGYNFTLPMPYCIIPTAILQEVNDNDAFTTKNVNGDILELWVPKALKHLSFYGLPTVGNPMETILSALRSGVDVELTNAFPLTEIPETFRRSMYINLLDIEDDDTVDKVFCAKHHRHYKDLITVVDNGTSRLEIPTILLGYIIGHEELEKHSGEMFTEDADGMRYIRMYVNSHKQEVLDMFGGTDKSKIYPGILLQEFGPDALKDAYKSMGDMDISDDIETEYWRMLLPADKRATPTEDIANALGESYDPVYEGESIIHNAALIT